MNRVSCGMVVHFTKTETESQELLHALETFEEKTV